MTKVLKITGIAVVAAAFFGTAAMPASAASAHSNWHSCSGGRGTAEHDVHGMYLRTSALKVRSPMNCASGRYALKTMRRKWKHAPDAGSPPWGYYDGYVSWHGRLVRWLNPCCAGLVRYHEYTSGTAFQATVQIWSD
jgi:hypothetical protein